MIISAISGLLSEANADVHRAVVADRALDAGVVLAASLLGELCRLGPAIGSAQLSQDAFGARVRWDQRDIGIVAQHEAEIAEAAGQVFAADHEGGAANNAPAGVE